MTAQIARPATRIPDTNVPIGAYRTWAFEAAENLAVRVNADPDGTRDEVALHLPRIAGPHLKQYPEHRDEVWAELVAAIDVRDGLDDGRYDYSVVHAGFERFPDRHDMAHASACDRVEECLQALCGRRNP